MRDGFGIITLVALFIFANMVISDSHDPKPTAATHKPVAALLAKCPSPGSCGPADGR